MSDFLSGRVALVTGAGAGIGASIAAALGDAGATVLVNDIAETRATAVSNALRERRIEAHPFAGDVVDSDSCRHLMDELLGRFERVDIVVNNAAAMIGLGRLWEMDDDEIAAGLSSLTASINVLRSLVPGMVDRNWGRIVNIGSMAGRVAIGEMPIYSAAKGGLHALTAALGYDLAPFGINVNAVAPGVIDTARQQARPPEVREARAREIPIRRLGTADEVADLVLFLVGQSAAYITGEVIPIDGGLP